MPILCGEGKTIRPSKSESSPDMIRKSIVLPQPDGPQQGADFSLSQAEGHILQDHTRSPRSGPERLACDGNFKLHAAAANARHAARPVAQGKFQSPA